MPKPTSGTTFAQAISNAMAAGLNSPVQIKQAVRRRGMWFITWVPQP